MSDTTLRFAFALGCVAGCWAQEREPGSDGSTEGDAPTVVTLIATDNDFRTPHTLEAGWITFRLVNHGGRPHMAQLVRLEPGMTAENFLVGYEEAFRARGPRPEWARRLGGPTVAVPQVENRGAESHEVTLLRLPPGKTVEDVRAWIRNPESPGEYLLMCLVTASDGRSHADHGMIQQIRVG